MEINIRIGDFFSQYQEVYYPGKKVIINAGDNLNQVFYLQSGVVKEYYISQTGNLFIVHLYPPGSFFPMSLTSQRDTASNYMDTLTSCVIRIAPFPAFSDFILSENEILKEFTSRLLNNMNTMTRRLGVIASGSAYQRTASTMAYLGKMLGKPVGGNGAVIIEEPILSHREIAGLVGIARETTSIQMKILENKGFVKYLGRKIFITDLQKLTEESD